MKAKKIVLLIALGVLLAGFLLWGIGAALGAKTLYLHNGELTVGGQPMGGFSIGSDVSVAASSKEGAAGLPQQMQVSRLKLLPDVGDMTVQPGDGWDLSYDLRYPERLHWSVEDGTLTVEYDYPEGEYSNVSIEDTITLTFPKGLELEQMEVESGMGSVEVRGITAQQMELSGGMGDFDATGINAAQRLYVDAGMGDVDISGSFGGEVELNCGMGSVNLEVQGASREDFDYDLDVGMGSLSVEGVEASGFLGGEYKTSDGKDRSITVDGGMGDVKISFAE